MIRRSLLQTSNTRVVNVRPRRVLAWVHPRRSLLLSPKAAEITLLHLRAVETDLNVASPKEQATHTAPCSRTTLWVEGVHERSSSSPKMNCSLVPLSVSQIKLIEAPARPVRV